MAKKAEDKLKRQFNSPRGYILTAIIMLLISYVLGSLAIDSGSLLHWLGAIVALIWGITRLIQGIKLGLKS